MKKPDAKKYISWLVVLMMMMTHASLMFFFKKTTFEGNNDVLPKKTRSNLCKDFIYDDKLAPGKMILIQEKYEI